jgi:hypothetical protein
VRTKVTLVLLFLNVALFFYIFKFEHTWRTEAASLEARRRVLGPEAADIRALEVKATAPGASFRLVRDDRDQWSLQQPLEWPANPAAVSAIIHELQLLEHEVSFPTRDLGKNGNPGLADYGLATPKIVVVIESGHPKRGGVTRTELKIGDVTKGNRLYVLSPTGDRVHVVNRSLVESVSLTPDQLRLDALFTIPVFIARSLSVVTASAPGVDDPARAAAGSLRIRLRRDRDRWSFETPIVARANKLAVDTTINDLNVLRAKTLIGPAAPGTGPASAPTLRIMLEGNGRHETLYLGESAGAPGEFLGQLEGRATVFTVAMPPALLQALRDAQIELREKRLLDFDPRSVASITVASPLGGQPTITLQRLENAAAGPSAQWQVIRRSGGNQGPESLAADPELVQQLLAKLSLLSAQTFESDAPTAADLETWGFNRPEREITLTFSAPAAGETAPAAQVLRLGTPARREGSPPARRVTYARVGTVSEPGNTISTLDPEAIGSLPLEPIAWRNRQVQELPAAARFTGLKVTDLANATKPPLEIPFDAAGAPTVPSALPLANSLRRLQAKVFVAGADSQNGADSGQEPWRYRIDATLSLPDGTGEQKRTFTLYVTKRLGGARQLAGNAEIGAVFEVEQALIDALWPLTEGARDPGPPPPPVTVSPTPSPTTPPGK